MKQMSVPQSLCFLVEILEKEADVLNLAWALASLESNVRHWSDQPWPWPVSDGN